MSKLGIDANRRLLEIITERGHDEEKRSAEVLRAGLRFQTQGVRHRVCSDLKAGAKPKMGGMKENVCACKQSSMIRSWKKNGCKEREQM